MKIETIDSLPSDDVCLEISDFLACFVRDGGLPSPLPGDEMAQTWLDRLNWWWHANPFATEGLPLAWLLRAKEDDRIVGFHGFIPHDYEIDGDYVPSLITTTFFVHPDYRSHSMKLVLKLNKLGREYQLLDGTPSPEMQAILDKFSFENRTEIQRYNIVVKKSGLLNLKSSLLKMASLGEEIPPEDVKQGLKLIQNPEEIGSVPPFKKDGALRRSVTKDSLIWMTNAGHGERHFFGLVDDKTDELRAFVIGLEKSQRGVKACRILEYGAFDENDKALVDLITTLANEPETCGLPASVDMLLWSVFDDALKTELEFEPEIRESSLYYKLPATLQDREKKCLPSEGDLILL